MGGVTSKGKQSNTEGGKKSVDIKYLLKLIIPALIGIGIAFIPAPEMLTTQAMVYIGIFMAVIIWLVLDVVPDVYVGIFAMCLFVVFNIGDLKVVFSPFAGSTVWLVIGALGMGAVVASTGLLKRVAFFILKLFPENYRGQIMALFAAGLVVSPLIPSTTAKSAILCPFASQISGSLGYEKGSKGARGLFNTAWLGGGVLGMAFYSGCGTVFIMLGFLAEEQQHAFDWFSWLAMAAMWLVVLVVLSYILTVTFLKPEPGAVAAKKGFAAEQLKNLGKMTKNEKIAALILVCALLGWMTGSITGIDSEIIALLALAAMGITGLMSAADFKTKIPWGTVVFIGAVLSVAAQLSILGIDKWLAAVLGPVLAPVMANPYILIAVVCIATYVLRLGVISMTATIAIFFAVFGGLAQAAGINIVVILFAVVVSSFVWHFSFTNATYMAALASTNGEMVEHKDNVLGNIMYMGANLVACLACVPIWQMLGYM